MDGKEHEDYDVGELLLQIADLEEKMSNCKTEKECLQCDIIELQEKNKALNNCLAVLGKGKSKQLYMAQIKSGCVKSAYKEQASLGKVLVLYRKGMSKQEIADTLGVGIATVFRRLQELKKLGLVE